MFILKKLSSNLFKLTDSQENRIIAIGDRISLKINAEAEGFDDLDLAIQIMDQTGDTAAEFGIFKRFLFTK